MPHTACVYTAKRLQNVVSKQKNDHDYSQNRTMLKTRRLVHNITICKVENSVSNVDNSVERVDNPCNNRD